MTVQALSVLENVMDWIEHHVMAQRRSASALMDLSRMMGFVCVMRV